MLVLEPAFGAEGRLKTQRKGVGGAELVVTGRSAHAGIEPEKGVNAVHELAQQIERLARMNDFKRGLTVQATVIEGGTVSNVVPARARAEVDIRFTRMADGAKIERAIRALKPVLRGARLAITGGVNRPPLERTAGHRKTFCYGAKSGGRNRREARGGGDGRRVGRKFHRGTGRADARWTGLRG